MIKRVLSKNQLLALSVIMMILTLVHLSVLFGLSQRLQSKSAQKLIIEINEKLTEDEISNDSPHQYKLSDKIKIDVSESIAVYKDTLILESFDPNYASEEILINVGITPRVASNIIKYRKAGGMFLSLIHI